MIIKASTCFAQLTELSQELNQGSEQINTPPDLGEILSPSLDTILVPQGDKFPMQLDSSEGQAASYSLKSELQKAVYFCTDYCFERSTEDPVENLRCAQRFLLSG